MFKFAFITSFDIVPVNMKKEKIHVSQMLKNEKKKKKIFAHMFI